MVQYIFGRMMQAVIVLIIVSIAVFLLVFASGDPIRTMVPLSATSEDVEVLREYFGLDKPVYVQYIRFVQNALQGDMGDSFRYRQGSLQLVMERLPSTALLAVLSITLAVLAGVPLGIVSATRRGSIADYLATTLSLLSISTPSFWLGLLLIMLFAEKLGWLPPSGREQPASFILPAATMAAGQVGGITRVLRSSILEALSSEYITTARSKGLTERTVLYVHALRNALIPTVTLVGLNTVELIGGSVIIETIFAWGGAGWLMMQAIYARDLPLIRANVLILAALITLVNLIVDITYGIVDPRIRHGGVLAK